MNINNKIGFFQWFNQEKGLGVIIPEDGSREVMLDIIWLDEKREKQYKSLENGQKVVFKVERGHKVTTVLDVVLI
ncbi:cold shock domain-containing protein [Neisseria sp. Ec49-e6-T10]|uniref:cold shock domain-containing protein n=1 Tax=Neisseria sp. Ec49-e6-T10 TaxID=3140744 RepID=UPI003EC156B8